MRAKLVLATTVSILILITAPNAFGANQPTDHPGWSCKNTQPALKGQAPKQAQQEFNNYTVQQFTDTIALCTYGWTGSERTLLHGTIEGESHWSCTTGTITGSYGLPQSNPGRKMAAYGADWRTNCRTQVRWMLNYIQGRYGRPSRLPRPGHAGY